MKMYFKSGKGIKNPVDVNGNKIKEGDTLTHCWFEGNYTDFFRHYLGISDLDEIEKRVNEPSVLVKRNEEGFFYGEGISNNSYMHDFRFKYTKKINL